MKKGRFVFSLDSNLLFKGALLTASAGLALILSSDKKTKKKNKSFVSKAKSINNTLSALSQAFYLHDLKKKAENDGFPVTVETAEIIDI